MKVKNVILIIGFFAISFLFFFMCSSTDETLNEGALNYVPFDYSIPDGMIEDPNEKEAMIQAKINNLLETNKIYWGSLPEDTEILLYFFEDIWSYIGRYFPGFVGLDIDWDAFGEESVEILEGINDYGQYASIMTKMGYMLKEGHSLVTPGRVERKFTKKNAPVINLSSWHLSTIGACYTVTDKEELVITKINNKKNPYDFEQGDEIVGFNGVPWHEWIERLVESGIPIYQSPGAAEPSIKYNLLRAGMKNANLFETINIKRYATGEIETLPIEYLTLNTEYEPCSEYINDVPGVKTPRLKSDSHQTLTYGIIDEINIGYIYLTDLPQGFNDFDNYENWNPYETTFAKRFEKAILELMNTDGLILDLRYNLGGRDGVVFKGLAHLINKEESIKIFKGMMRDNASDDRTALIHEDLNVNHPLHPDEPNQYYDKPIVVMTGPDCISAGDALVHFLSKFPEFTIIGKETNGSNIHVLPMTKHEYDNEYVNHYMGFYVNYFMDEPDKPLLRRSDFVDIPIWFTKEDVANGIDTVREYAIKLCIENF